MTMLVESASKGRMDSGYAFSDVGLSISRFAVGVVRQPERLDVKEMHSQSRFENAADVTLPASFRTDKEDKHAL